MNTSIHKNNYILNIDNNEVISNEYLCEKQMILNELIKNGMNPQDAEIEAEEMAWALLNINNKI